MAFIMIDAMFTLFLFFFLRTSNFAVEVETKVDVLIFLCFEFETLLIQYVVK